jgi:multiple sugar transport system substrate-binding protein
MRGGARFASLTAAAAALMAVCACAAPTASDTLTFSGSALGEEAVILQRQLTRFSAEHGVPVQLRVTPDAADQRHQLYVQWLNAHAVEPDVLQLDVVWTPEFAAAGWLLPLDAFAPPVGDFFPATISANRWDGALFALPWFVDVGVLYWRTDLLDRAPLTFAELTSVAARARETSKLQFGFAWQGARYEGLIATFLEHLGGFGGRILDDEGHVVVDGEAAVRALTYMRDSIYTQGVVPGAVLTWHEEEARFAFQNGDAVLMRNWPYAFTLLQRAGESRVAGTFGIAPMPSEPGGQPTGTIGGSQLAVNARTRHAADAYALIAYLTAPEQMLERATAIGQYPPRPAMYDTPAMDAALGAPARDIRRIVERATPRPVTPVYTELSEILQIHLHQALTGQAEPGDALTAAAGEMRILLDKTGLASRTSEGARR